MTRRCPPRGRTPPAPIELRRRYGLAGGLGRGGDDVGPREAVGLPQPVEDLVDGVVEAVPYPEVVDPPLRTGGDDAEPAEAALDVGRPRHLVADVDLVGGRRRPEGGIEPVASPQQRRTQHLAGPVLVELARLAERFEGAAG